MKIFITYLKMYLPFILGMVLFSYGITNLFSSLLLFLGGYVAIKNTFDYRLVRKNINRGRVLDNHSVNNVSLNDGISKDGKKARSMEIKPINHNAEQIAGFKRTRRYTRVRRRY